MFPDVEEAMDTSTPVHETSSESDATNNPSLSPLPLPLSRVASLDGASDVPQPAAPPCGPVPTQIVFSFDTTGSMSSCLEEVQNHLKTIINRLFMDIPALQIALIAHGDYCDSEHFYVIKSLDFTNDVTALLDFVSHCGGTGGGDYEECYELVLRKVRESLSWMSSTTKSMVMIGDAVPHPPGHGGNDDQIDWREEVDRLHGELGVRIYAVQCLADYNGEAKDFWQELSKRSFGKHLEMNEFGTVIDLMMAICYKEGGNPALFEAYEREVRARECPLIGSELDRMFNTLRDGAPPAAACPSTGPIAKVRPLIAQGVASRKKNKTPGAAAKHVTPRVAQAVARKNAAVTPKAAKSTKHGSCRRVVQCKLRRENVTNSQFILNDLRWSAWQLYKSRSADGSVQTRRGLFPQDRQMPAVYELSVQTHQRSRRQVVFCGTTRHLLESSRWDANFLRQKHVRDQLSAVLQQDCLVFVRRAVLPRVVKYGGQKYTTPQQVSTLLRSKYCYAWSKTDKTASGQKSRGREVVRRGRAVSSVIVQQVS